MVSVPKVSCTTHTKRLLWCVPVLHRAPIMAASLTESFSGIQRYGVTLNAPIVCPLFREYLIALSFLQAQRETLSPTLQSGHSVVNARAGWGLGS
jgi:hypothetical protein